MGFLKQIVCRLKIKCGVNCGSLGARQINLIFADGQMQNIFILVVGGENPADLLDASCLGQRCVQLDGNIAADKAGKMPRLFEHTLDTG